MDLNANHFPNTLRRHRRLMAYTPKQVAKLLGHKNTSRLNLWESGKQMPSVINLLKLSVIYRTLPTEFYFDRYLEIRREIHEKEKLDAEASEQTNLNSL